MKNEKNNFQESFMRITTGLFSALIIINDTDLDACFMHASIAPLQAFI